jgi:hypothetical protein
MYGLFRSPGFVFSCSFLHITRLSIVPVMSLDLSFAFRQILFKGSRSRHLRQVGLLKTAEALLYIKSYFIPRPVTHVIDFVWNSKNRG